MASLGPEFSKSSKEVIGRGAVGGGPAREVGSATARGVPDGPWRCLRDEAFKAGESGVTRETISD
jgi:hypothetical protein